MASTVPAFHVTREQFHLAWDPAVPPIASVASGSVVTFDCLDASGGQITAGSTVDDLAQLDFSRVDQVNGPVAVEGVEAGDTLQIDLLDFRPADWGWTAAIPGFGLLADDFPDPVLRITRLPVRLVLGGNELVFRCGGGSFSARLEPPPSDLFLDVKIGWHIGQMEKFVPVIHDRLIDPGKQPRLEGAKQIRIQGLHNALDGWATMVIVTRMIGKVVTHPAHFFRC